MILQVYGCEMNKKDFLNLLSQKLECTKVDADKILSSVLESIALVMRDNDELRFVGFGTFKAKQTEATKVKTPRGTVAEVPAQRQVRFSTGSDFKKTVNS